MVGSTTIEAVIIGKQLYAPIPDVLSFVKIKTELSPDRSKITGFLRNENEEYVIDLNSKKAIIGDKKLELTNDELFTRGSDAYLRTDVFQSIFGFECNFNYRSLQVTIHSEWDLPAVLEARRVQTRDKHSLNANNNIPVDKTFDLHRSLFSLGILDWSTQANFAQAKPNGSYDLRLSGTLLGGELSGRFTRSSSDSLNWQAAASQISWHWLYGIVDSKILSQIHLGSISSFSTIGLSDSVLGIQLTNHSTQQKQQFASYTINDRTEPDWNVELYVNELLVDYTRADPAGNFSFTIPLTYGSTRARLKFYGPNGQVESKELELRIPYSFLPPGTLEYTATAGTYRNDLELKRAIAQGEVSFGITNFMTIGTGTTYDRSNFYHPLLPYASVSLAPIGSWLVGAQYLYGKNISASADWSNQNVSFNATYLHPLSLPEFVGMRSGDQWRSSFGIALPWIDGNVLVSVSDQTIAENLGTSGISGQVFGMIMDIPISTSITTSFERRGFNLKPVSCNGRLASSFTMYGLRFRYDLLADILTHSLTSIGTGFQYSFSSFLSTGIQCNYSVPTKDFITSAQFTWRLPFAQIGSSGSISGSNRSAQTFGSGSLMYDATSSQFIATEQSLSGKGGVLITPFIDNNNNGKYEKDEQLVAGFSVTTNGGRVVRSTNGQVKVLDLDSYGSYIMRVSLRGVENVALVPAFKTFKVTVGGNHITSINIPFLIGGEISGKVSIKIDSGAPRPIGGVRIKLKKVEQDTTEITPSEEILSYSSGEFYYFGLPPGKYLAYIDTNQLALKKLRSIPEYVPFELKNLPNGDVVANLKFELGNSSNSATKEPEPKSP